MKILSSVFLLIALIIVVNSVKGQDTSLIWNRNPETNIICYVVYYGQFSKAYTMSTNVGNITNFVVKKLSSGPWYFAITAVNSSGLESDFSNEVVNNIVTNKPVSNQSLVIRSGIESAPTPVGPWIEILSTYLPVTIESNRFYRPILSLIQTNQESPPTP